MRSFLFAIVIGYVVAYGLLRQTQQEVWQNDGQTYVIFPVSLPLLYYAFRPITWLDARVTGMHFHLGPHT
ncbi:MAG: hypothetical protein I8H94_02485 [Rhodobacteraceae bacterium]|nr:hypothetical protein [Paracoccaceae bacterium]